jgi:hypothetical protein
MEDILPLIGVPPTEYVATPSLFDAVLEETGDADAKQDRADEAANAQAELDEIRNDASGDIEIALPVNLVGDEPVDGDSA